eukprot:452273-Rhodomonas_salina.2
MTVGSAICLRACHAMPGTDTAYGTMCYLHLRALYDGWLEDGSCAMPGTDIEYTARYTVLHVRYAMSGTSIGHAPVIWCYTCAMQRPLAIPCPLLNLRAVLPGSMPQRVPMAENQAVAKAGVAPDLSSYGFPMQCPVLTYAALLSRYSL